MSHNLRKVILSLLECPALPNSEARFVTMCNERYPALSLVDSNRIIELANQFVLVPTARQDKLEKLGYSFKSR